LPSIHLLDLRQLAKSRPVIFNWTRRNANQLADPDGSVAVALSASAWPLWLNALHSDRDASLGYFGGPKIPSSGFSAKAVHRDCQRSHQLARLSPAPQPAAPQPDRAARRPAAGRRRDREGSSESSWP
jgi:hypothetical protein